MCQQYKEQKSRWKMGKQEFILLLKLIIAFNCFVFLQIIVIESYSRYLTIIEIDPNLCTRSKSTFLLFFSLSKCFVVTLVSEEFKNHKLELQPIQIKRNGK